MMMNAVLSRKTSRIILAAVLFAGCSGKSSSTSPAGIQVIDYRQVIPADGLPAEVKPMLSNNNLDIVSHLGRLYFVFRTGRSHFASSETRLYVMSTANEVDWKYERTLHTGKDLREPRFLSLNGKLFLYFAELGDNLVAFEPGRMLVTVLSEPGGSWSDPVTLNDKGFIPWRAKNLNGVPYLVGYLGGENEYNLTGDPLTVLFMTTSDGYNWHGLNGKDWVTKSGGSETDFAFDPDGNLFAVQRNEPGDETGWGMRICWADKADITDWKCKGDKKKYDSPLMFSHKGNIYLVGRRNLTDTGNYDLEMRDLGAADQTAAYLVDYSSNKKRCSLWKYDTENKEIDFVLDLPSRGDTCFASIVEKSGTDYLLYNYTSPLNGGDIPWMAGQLGQTIIYSVVLRFPN